MAAPTCCPASRLAATLACLAFLAAQSLAAAQTNYGLGNNRVRVRNDAEAAMAGQMLKAFAAVSQNIVSGIDQGGMVVAAAAPPNASTAAMAGIAGRVLASALASWQLSVIDAPSNRGLRPEWFTMYGRDHYYQIPKDPIGTLVMFHGCYHSASGSWPYDPARCPGCLGLPEEVAHVKQALAWGYAVLAVESKNQEYQGRCFSSSTDPAISDQPEAPYIMQAFLYNNGLRGKPVYTMGISAGAAFAIKIPKAFYTPWFDFKISGVISEVNAVEWGSWGLVDSRDRLRFPAFPSTVFVQMERDNSTAKLIQSSVQNLRKYGIHSDVIVAPTRPVSSTWFSDRSPVITPRQSAAIYAALLQLKIVDKAGWPRDDPRMGARDPRSPLFQWSRRLVKALPWLSMDPNAENKILSALSDRSTIFEEMNAAFSWHEGIADYVRPCLAWLQSNGTADLQYLTSKLTVSNLAELTMTRVYPAPLPPASPPSPTPPPPAPPGPAQAQLHLGRPPPPPPTRRQLMRTKG